MNSKHDTAQAALRAQRRLFCCMYELDDTIQLLMWQARFGNQAMRDWEAEARCKAQHRQ